MSMLSVASNANGFCNIFMFVISNMINGTVDWQSVTSCVQASSIRCGNALSQTLSIPVGNLQSIWDDIFRFCTVNLKNLELLNDMCSSGRFQPLLISPGLTVASITLLA